WTAELEARRGLVGPIASGMRFQLCRGYCGDPEKSTNGVMPLTANGSSRLDQRTALPDQCLHPAEADVRPPRRKARFDPLLTIVACSGTSRIDVKLLLQIATANVASRQVSGPCL